MLADVVDTTDILDEQLMLYSLLPGEEQKCNSVLLTKLANIIVYVDTCT